MKHQQRPIEKVWSQARYRRLHEVQPPRMLHRLGTEAFDEALARRTLSIKLPMWRDYAQENLRWAGERLNIRSHHLRPFTQLANRFSDVPAVVIGFGPSFHHNRALLCGLPRDRCLLVATDRAVPLLWRGGRIPDVVVNLDSGDQTQAFFVGTPGPYLDALVEEGWVGRRRSDYYVLRSMEDWRALMADRGRLWQAHPLLPTDECGRVFTTLAAGGPLSLTEVAEAVGLCSRPLPKGDCIAILAVTANPQVRTWFRGPKYWYLPYLEQRLSHDLERQTGQPCLPTAGNVGTTAMNLSVILGARPVYLVGMDLWDNSTSPEGASRERALGGNQNLVSYAVATRAMLVDPVLRPLYQESEVTNLSGGILHGPFIKKGDVEKLPDLLRNGKPVQAPRGKRARMEEACRRLAVFGRTVRDSSSVSPRGTPAG